MTKASPNGQYTLRIPLSVAWASRTNWSVAAQYHQLIDKIYTTFPENVLAAINVIPLEQITPWNTEAFVVIMRWKMEYGTKSGFHFYHSGTQMW